MIKITIEDIKRLSETVINKEFNRDENYVLIKSETVHVFISVLCIYHNCEMCGN